MLILRKIFDLLLYGNFFIAFCAAAMLLQTEFILFGQFNWTYLTTFTFSSTLCIYALHRLVGMKKVSSFKEKYRYHIIEKYRSHILLYAVIGGGVAAFLFFQLSLLNQLLIVVPAFLAIGYVVPFFGKQRRLRDFHFIKIFLVAIVWAYITVVLPVLERPDGWQWLVSVILVERILFIFAITIPFDIRDLQVDKHIEVKTIPSSIGEKRSKILALGLLVLAGGLAACLWGLDFYPTFVLLGILSSYIFTGIIINHSSVEQHDYFFTGLMDGTMIFQFLLILFFNGLLSNF